MFDHEKSKSQKNIIQHVFSTQPSRTIWRFWPSWICDLGPWSARSARCPSYSLIAYISVWGAAFSKEWLEKKNPLRTQSSSQWPRGWCRALLSGFNPSHSWPIGHKRMKKDHHCYLGIAWIIRHWHSHIFSSSYWYFIPIFFVRNKFFQGHLLLPMIADSSWQQLTCEVMSWPSWNTNRCNLACCRLPLSCAKFGDTTPVLWFHGRFAGGIMPERVIFHVLLMFLASPVYPLVI